MQDKSKSKSDPSQQRGGGNQNPDSFKGASQGTSGSGDMGGSSAGRTQDNNSSTRGTGDGSSASEQKGSDITRNRNSDD